jgi:hypothetical protein
MSKLLQTSAIIYPIQLADRFVEWAVFSFFGMNSNIAMLCGVRYIMYVQVLQVQVIGRSPAVGCVRGMGVGLAFPGSPSAYDEDGLAGWYLRGMDSIDATSMTLDVGGGRMGWRWSPNAEDASSASTPLPLPLFCWPLLAAPGGEEKSGISSCRRIRRRVTSAALNRFDRSK